MVATATFKAATTARIKRKEAAEEDRGEEDETKDGEVAEGKPTKISPHPLPT